MAENKADIHRFEVDLAALEAEAKASESKEVYHQVSNGDDYRLGIIIEVASDDTLVFSVELLASFASGQDEIQVHSMTRVVRLSKELRRRGYSISHGDDGWLLFLQHLPRDAVVNECRTMISLMIEFKADNEEPDDAREKEIYGQEYRRIQ